jgi:hypothetical protein
VAKRTAIMPITSDDWLTLADTPGIRARITKDPYSKAYPALLAHFRNLKTLDWANVVVGVHVVYGWMPTIPRLGGIMAWDEEKKQNTVNILLTAQSGHMLSVIELNSIKALCNNSIIGASKLLHFLRPDVFPIWDSRVAKVFTRNRKINNPQINKIPLWRLYVEQISGWALEPAVKQKCAELRQLAAFLQDSTDLRLVELVMFHVTESKRSREAD